MDGVLPRKKERRSHDRILANQALSRTAGAPLIPGNDVTLLKNAAENYPAWLKAIQSARKTIYFECYIIRDDDQGNAFAEALITKAKEGVKVRLMYDWLGALGKTSHRYWRMLTENGIEVRCFNPPKFYEPFGWLSRDHRKVLCIDSCHGFVSGLCVGQPWVGDPAKGIDPWRDTGVEVRGPAVADIAHGFAESWATTGDRIPDEELLPREGISAEGNISIRVVASIPNTGALYRLDQLVAAIANETLWLSDAYFMGTSSYVQALCAAAVDGVDVRLLVPGASDIGALVPFSRAGYRPLLESGIRIFEWNGTMMHAKSAVADGRIARVGSSNLNYASWLGNWEMDVIVEDENFGHAMFEQYLEDLQNATEIVLNLRKRIRPAAAVSRKKIRGENRGSAGRVAAGAIRIGNTVGAAIANRRALGPAEARVMLMAGLVLAVLAILTFVLPQLIAFPLAVISIWVAIVLLYKSWKLRKTHTEPPPPKKEIT
ncbi:MAG TPA: phospholipase D-like domain-containing protein [Acidobacteriota bacterium]|jgi:cardiolipin synthase